MISVSILFRFIFVATGLFLIFRSVMSLSRRVMSDFMCLWWCVISVASIVFGLEFDPKPLQVLDMGWGNAVMLVIAWIFFLEAVFYLTKCLSKVERENRELAMQVALLRDDIRRIHEEMNAPEAAAVEGEQGGATEEAAVRHQHDGVRRRRDRAS